MMVAVGLILGLVAVLFSLFPIFRPRQTEEVTSSAGEAEVAHLEARKNRLVDGIHDLDFEFASGKVAEKDYQAAREDLMHDAALVLQRMEAKAADEIDTWIDREVQARRGAGVTSGKHRAAPEHAMAPAHTTSTADEKCPSCKTPIVPGARFCDHCGHAMTRRCNACDTELRDEARFCAQCGVAV